MANSSDDPYVEGLLGLRACARLPARALRVELALGALLVVAIAALAVLAPSGRGVSLLGAAGLIAAYAIAQQVLFDVGAGYTVPTQLVLMPTLLLAPPALVPVLIAAGLLVGRLPQYVRGEIHLSRLAFVLPDAAHALAPAVVVAALAPTHPGLESWPVLGLALVSQIAFDAGFGTLRERLELGVPPQLQLRLLAWVYAVDVALAPIGVLVGVAAYSQPLAIVAVLPLMGLFVFFARERRERIDNALALSHAYRGTALLMSDLLEADDAYTGGEHSHGVVALALAVGDAVRLGARDRRNLEFAALLHDIGKIRVADEIINKPGKLTDAEVGIIVRHHHERWDGGGYPDGIADEAIPLAARIICACDTYNAMTTNRPYRAALPVADALAELERCSGSQFDPAVVQALLRTVARHPDHRPARTLLELAA